MNFRDLTVLGVALVVSCTANTAAAIACADGYDCFDEKDKGVVWVYKKEGNVHGPTCSSVCQDALCGSTAFHNCHDGVDFPANAAEFNDRFADAFGFTCTKGGCWKGVSGAGQVWLGIQGDKEKKCYFPESGTPDCEAQPGNANCFGKRFSILCPCKAKPLDGACPWSCPPQNTKLAQWPSANDTSCLGRINYWRKRACDEGWPECPPCGLPPMVECVGCHECANSQAAYDKKNGAHKSFKRCGDRVQGEGGGKTCADVIDAFVSERQVFPDSNGKVVCRGHCGPIVKAGCQTFFWGRDKDSGFHTLNWRTCDTEKCNNYCKNPTDGECFSLEPDVTPSNTCLASDTPTDSVPTPQNQPPPTGSGSTPQNQPSPSFLPGIHGSASRASAPLISVAFVVVTAAASLLL
eukprot:GFYU01024043.1.p1 GENE.GFYU01024043.1~~GFYU01024043.1.p1  ORF type:complete len:407 (-),score=65.49 GFYU01024043.1:259-1479(-)